MNLCWVKAPGWDTSGHWGKLLHVLDVQRCKPNDGTHPVLCGAVLNGRENAVARCAFGDAREGKCPKCFKESRKRMQKEKASYRRKP